MVIGPSLGPSPSRRVRCGALTDYPSRYALRRWFALGSGPSGSRARFLREQPRRQQRHRTSGRALGLAFLPRDAGDVEMRPVEFLREARQAARCRDAARGPPADVGEVREVAFERFLVVVPQRHLPRAIVRLVTGREQVPRERVVVAEHAAGDMPEADHDGAGQSRDVDNGFGKLREAFIINIISKRPSFL